MRFWKKFIIFMSVMGPGIITANIDNDASGITTYSVAGARFGYHLLWTLIPTTAALIVVQEMIGRMGVITGKGLAALIREHYGIKAAFFIMLGLLIANFGNTVANFAGWAASMEILGFSKYIMIPAAVLLILILVTKGTYRSVEKILLLACTIFVGYIISGIMAQPDWPTVFKNAIVPELQWESEYLMMSIAIIGTTITPWMQFYLQSTIAEKGIQKSQYQASRLDVIIGCSMTDIISFFIIVTCGTLLFPYGIRINEASEAALALRPFAGDYASLIFSVSLANASFLGAIIVPLATAYYICEAMGWEAGINKEFRQAPQFFTIYTSTIGVSAFIVLIPDAPLVFLMVLSALINGLLLPPVLIYALLLANKKELMGEHINSKFYNYIAWSMVSGVICLTFLWVLRMVF